MGADLIDRSSFPPTLTPAGQLLQAQVMGAIYGKEGVKAGFTTGQCLGNVSAAIDGMITDGVGVVILGCTELPLLLPHQSFVGTTGTRVSLVNPTDVLAQQCVALAVAAEGRPTARSENQTGQFR